MENVKFLAFARTALKNMFKKPATTDYPFAPATFPERMRGHIEIETKDCICCGLCMRSCPPGAILVDKAAGKWVIDRFDCVQCGNCANVCPEKCLKLVSGYTKPDDHKSKDSYDVTPPVIKKPLVKPAAEAVQKSKKPD